MDTSLGFWKAEKTGAVANTRVPAGPGKPGGGDSVKLDSTR